MSIAAIIVAAGRGTRAMAGATGTDCPKQYALIEGKAVLSRTIEALATHSRIDDIVVVIHPDDHVLYQEMLERDGASSKLSPAVSGGAQRQDSVRAGLVSLAQRPGGAPDHVVIHDAARPSLKHDTIDRVLAALETDQGALAALPVADTLLQADANNVVTSAVARDGIWRAQTPQGFVFQAILDAHTKAETAQRDAFTDDASLFEWAGGRVRVVMGSEENRKITTSEDLLMAQTRSQTAASMQVRVGTGFDVHRCGPGDHVWLCGVKIPAAFTLIGHSDADVALHALTDAILGAIGDGDIGCHFPPSDLKWKGAASAQFLADASKRVVDRGGRLNNVDVTLICETPKIGPHREAMRAEIARILDLSITQVSVKATTSEQLGFTGRGDGLAAMATATVCLP